MTGDELPAQWPPALGRPLSKSLLVAFAGFDNGVERLMYALDTEKARDVALDFIGPNVEVSTILWFARSAVESIRNQWAGGTGSFDDDAKEAGEASTLHAWRWARDRAGHQLASTAAYAPGLLPGPDLFPGEHLIPYTPHWIWAAVDDVPPGRPGRTEDEGRNAYGGVLAGQALKGTIINMAAWLSLADARLAEQS